LQVASCQPRAGTGVVESPFACAGRDMKAARDNIDERIWQVVAAIPAGCVATYGDVARHAGLPNAARRVGRSLRCLPARTRIPWFRVVNAQGRLSLPPESRSHATQRRRLQAEGVAFRDNGSIDLRRYRWRP